MLADGADAVRRRRRGARAVDGVLGRSALDPRRLEGADHRQRRAHRATMRGGRSMRAPTRSSCRITAGGNSTASRRRCACCRKCVAAVDGPHRSAARRRHPPRQRHRQGALPRRARGADRPRLRVRPRRRRRPGVARAIEILRADVVRTMKLLGCASTTKLDASYVDVPTEWMRMRSSTTQV